MERLMLLDGYGLVYRGYFALPPLTTSKGDLVNGVFGFASIVLRGIQDLQPDYLAVSFDLPGPTFRHDAYAEYKATRVRMPDDLRDQFPKVREVVKALRIPVYEMQGSRPTTSSARSRSSSMATTISRRRSSPSTSTCSSSSRPRVRLMTTRSGVENTVMYDVARIEERFGLRPDQMIDYKALKGDPTDNIPGVPGVGEKTAAKLIREFGDLDSLLSRLDEVTPAKLADKLREHVDQIRMGHELSKIVRDLPIDFDLSTARLGDYDRDTVVRLFREYEFRTLIERLPPMEGESAEQRTERLRSVAESGYVPAARVAGRPEGWGPSRDVGRQGAQGAPGGGNELQLRLDFDAVGASAGPAPAQRRRALERSDADASSNGTGPRAAFEPAPDLPTALAAAIVDPGRIEVRGADRIADLDGWLSAQTAVGVRLLLDDPRPRRGNPLALAVAGTDGRVVAADGPEASDDLRHRLERLGTPLVGHEVKPLLVAAFAEDESATPTPIAFDTQIAAYILNASLRSQTIADVVAENLDQILPPPAELPATARAGLEALSAIAVREPLERRLADTSLDRLFREVELPLIPVLARMEAVGVALDREALACSIASSRPRSPVSKPAIYHDVGHEFNLGSPKQLEQVLFFELNLPKGRRTKTGFSTDASVLEDLRPAHPMIDKLLEWRVYTKLRSTYVEALPMLLAADGRLHTTFHQAVASTGRLSSSDPNLQNIPIRTALGRRIRRAFVAGDPDRVLLAADYSQIELRILAHVSGDEHLKDAFARGADIHRETAARVLHKDPDDIDHDERSMAKMVNFGLAYGMSDFGLASRANIPRVEAQAFINSYFAAYSGISYYMMASRSRPRRRAGSRRSSVASARSRSCGHRTRRSAAPASGWPSTCRSRERPPTSRRSR